MSNRVAGTSKHGRSAELMRQLKYELDFDAAQELVKLYRNTGAKFGDKIKIAQELMGYQYPKLKAIELAARQGEAVVFNIDLSGAAKMPVAKEPEDVEAS